MDATSLPSKRARSKPTRLERQQRHQNLRIRAVLHEGDRERAQEARMGGGRKHQPLSLTPDQEAAYPTVAAYLNTHDGWPPTITRSSGAKLGQIPLLRSKLGRLVMLRIDLGVLDHLPLHSPELREEALNQVKSWLKFIARHAFAYLYAIQRGGLTKRTHVHIIVPLRYLSKAKVALLEAAESGASGGCILIPSSHHDSGAVHAVIMDEEQEDDERVAAYMARDPEGGLHHPELPSVYLSAIERELKRKQSNPQRVRLSGCVGFAELERLHL